MVKLIARGRVFVGRNAREIVEFAGFGLIVAAALTVSASLGLLVGGLILVLAASFGGSWNSRK